MKRVELVLEDKGLVPAALAHRPLEVRAKLRCDVGGDRDAADAAHRVETQRNVVIAAQQDEVLAA